MEEAQKESDVDDIVNTRANLQSATETIVKLVKRTESLDKAVGEEIENRDIWEDKATKLADSVGVYFSESVGEHSSGNCPINNAHELLNQI